MDEIRIEKGFAGNILSNFLEAKLRKKTGCEMDIQLNELHITFSDGQAHIHLDADAEVEKEMLLRLLKEIGAGGK